MEGHRIGIASQYHSFGKCLVRKKICILDQHLETQSDVAAWKSLYVQEENHLCGLQESAVTVQEIKTGIQIELSHTYADLNLAISIYSTSICIYLLDDKIRKHNKIKHQTLSETLDPEILRI